jgi:hypothetical protein
MALEELDITNDQSFELHHNFGAEAEVIEMPLMDDYPNPENQFDVFLHNDGAQSGGTGGTGGVDPNAIAGAVGAVAGLASSLSQNRDETKQQLRTRCGRKPLFGKEKKKRYFECVDKFYGGGGADMGGGFDTKSMQTPYIPPVVDEPRGLSQGAKIGIGIAVVAVLGVGGYFLYKKMKK